MTLDRRVRHLRLQPTPLATDVDVSVGPGREASDALPAALQFLELLGKRPVDVHHLQQWVTVASRRGWADWQGATAWVAGLGDWMHGPLGYCETEDSTSAYLPIYRRTVEPSSGPQAGPGRPAGMLTLRWTPRGRQWQVHALTTL